MRSNVLSGSGRVTSIFKSKHQALFSEHWSHEAAPLYLVIHYCRSDTTLLVQMQMCNWWGKSIIWAKVAKMPHRFTR